ncbi:MAG: 8-amino-7-oxononanoate synthase [Deltaproteobacteria bacterium]|nr:8-amino-7-oxononanoate synthase [Deltaproteobacteria bacterium]
MERIEKVLIEIDEKGLRRTLRTTVFHDAVRVSIDTKDALLFCSNDYLGLSKDKRVIEATIKATEKYGAGSGAARLISGTMEPHTELEEKILTFKKTTAALLFNSGYAANTGAIPALIGRDGEIFSDKLNHASIVDGCILSRAKLTRYSHADMNSLEDTLKKSKANEKLIITDSVFSMDGDIAPIKDMALLAEKYDALLYIDDAHATGTLGKAGRGSLEHFAIEHNERIIQMGTLGKALGTFGAFIAADKKIIELLINSARSFVFTTSLPPSICASAVKAIEIIEKEPGLVKLLQENASLMRAELEKHGLDTMQSETQIIPVNAGDAKKCATASRALLEKGFFIQAVRPPTVPDGTSRLRITVSAAHSKEDIIKAAIAVKETLHG